MSIVRYWLPVCVWMAIIFIFSSRTRVSVSSDFALNFLFFKSLHLGEYALLFILCVRAIKNTFRKLPHTTMIFASYMFTLVYAITDELHQLYVPTREGRPRDVIIDALGALIAWILLYKLLPKAPKKLRRWVSNLEL